MIAVSNIAYRGACGSADFCSSAAHYAFTSAGSTPDGTTATGRVLGGIFGPNGENAGAFLDASNANRVEFRGDFVARRSPYSEIALANRGKRAFLNRARFVHPPP